MTLTGGDHSIGPSDGQLTINTYVGGLGAKMGHDLVLEAKRWDGTATIDAANPAASSVHVRVEVGSLEVIGATGGLKPLTENDKADIMQNRDKTPQTAKHPQIIFDSTGGGRRSTFVGGGGKPHHHGRNPAGDRGRQC